MRIENERMDILSRKSFPRRELFRLVFSSEGLLLEGERPLKGRGVYLRKSQESIDLARKKKLLERRFHLADCEAIYKQMEEKL